MQQQKGITRRTFLKSAAVATAATLYVRNSNATSLDSIGDELELICGEILDEKIISSSQENNNGKYDYESIDLSNKNGLEVNIEYYASKGKGQKPPIIILPMLARAQDKTERYFAQAYADAGLPSIIINNKKGFMDPLNEQMNEPIQEGRDLVDDVVYTFNELYKISLLNAMGGIEWVKSQKELDEERIGIFGISLGSIKAATLMGINKQIKAGVFGLVGGDFAKLLSTSREPNIKRGIDTVLKTLGEDRIWLEERLQDSFPLDPITHAHNIYPRKVQIYLAIGDGYIPFETGEELAEAIGENAEVIKMGGIGNVITRFPLFQAIPKIGKYMDPHIAAIANKRKVKNGSIKFFKEQLV